MLKYIVVFCLLVLITNSSANNNKKNIIKNLNNTKNLDFNFEQNINGKIENGNCTIEYPKKIFCEYARSNNKILVSNGKSLVIKTITSYYRYPLEKTALNFILDKDFLISKINALEERIVDSSFINYTIKEKDNEINIFFNKETFDLIGWQNTDIYQNFNITYLSSIRKNRIILKDIFELPVQN
ncbi:outer-membrane lipoprotein carrier protein LolA [Candidatus Pelagibacter sp.]|nr:outer-membrane lipoprotein carrier protein LolA [Candidatus Pelagibacter sp.]